MGAETRLWGGSLSAVLAAHLAVGVAAALWLKPPITDLPAGAFAVELAEFGGAKGARGAVSAAPPPPAAPQPAEVAPPPPPKPVEAEVALPKPKPIPKPAPKPKPVAKPAPQPPAKPAEAPQPQAATPAAPAQSAAAAAPAPVQTAPAAVEGTAGSPISGRLGAGGADAGSPLGRYKALVYHALWQKRNYPAVAQRMGYEGEVEIAFTVAADGNIGDVHVTRESGHGVLDREAVALLGRVRQFPPFPADLAARNLTFRIVIPFKLS